MSTTKPEKKSETPGEQEKLAALQNFENVARGGDAAPLAVQPPNPEPKIIDGYRILDRSEMPFGGALYPPTWNFAYKCPTTKQIANFSTLDEKNQPAVIAAVEELIIANYVIVDSETNQQVPNHEINDGERLFHFLKLREYYLHDKPIKYTTISQNYQEALLVELFASRLKYRQLNQTLLDCFDGRVFTIPVDGLEEPIIFRVPTFQGSGKIFKYIVKVYRESQSDDDDSSTTKAKDDEAFNKQFMLIAPFLFVTGSETIEQLKLKFKGISANDKVMDAYLTIINRLNFTNLERISYEYKGSEEETLIRFPGGWKSMFVDKTAFGGIFD